MTEMVKDYASFCIANRYFCDVPGLGDSDSLIGFTQTLPNGWTKKANGLWLDWQRNGYGVTALTDYPDAPSVAMDAIDVETGGASATLLWAPETTPNP
jgi:hypothetical protein